MPTINQLPLQSNVSVGDNLAVFSNQNGDTRRLPISALLTFFQEQFASPTLATNVYTPSTGFNIAAPTPVAEQQWILIRPAGTLATGTVTLPLNTSTPDGTEVLITTTQQITSFTLALNGAAAAFGDPSTLAAEDYFRMRFVTSQNSWFRIG